MLTKLKNLLFLTGFLVLGLSVFAIAKDSKVPDSLKKDPGIEVFKEYKCMSCHSIKVLGMEVELEEGEEKEELEEGEKEPPDLSGVAKEEFEDEFIEKFIRKKAKKDGKKHKKKFKGSEEEAAALIGFFQKLVWPQKDAKADASKKTSKKEKKK